MLYCRCPSASVFSAPTGGGEHGGITGENVSTALIKCGLIPSVIDVVNALQVASFHIDFDNVQHLKRLPTYIKVLSALLHCTLTVKPSLYRQVCLEAPRRERRPLALREIIQELPRTEAKHLTAAIGKDTENNPLYLDLSTAPHLLIAGTTGSGKSVLLNGILSSLLFNYSPNDLQLLLIDPKQVEMVKYRGIPHLVKDVITDIDEAEKVLSIACRVMDDRYKELSRQGLKSIVGTQYPRIAIVIDELSDLMMKSGGEGSELERSIIRIAQLGRAAGIHLIIATQRPTKQVLTGMIRANITCKIALQVSSIRESVVILDHKGAEALTGKGDALIKLPTQVEEVRFQSVYTSDNDIQAIVDFWKYKGVYSA